LPLPRRHQARAQDPDENGNNPDEGAAGALADLVHHRLCALADAGDDETRAIAVRLIDSVLKNHRAAINGGNARNNNGEDNRDPTYSQPSSFNGRGGIDNRGGELVTIGDLRRAVRGAYDHALAMDAALRTARGCGATDAQLAKVGSPAGVYRVALRALGHPRPESVHREALPHVLAQWRQMPAMDRAAAGGRNAGFAKRFPDVGKINASGGSPWR
jgi:hypothetical protein